MSDTPRTDSQPLMLLFGEMVVPFKFAKQLERELAEAKEQLNEHRDELVRRGVEMAGYINQLAAIHSPESCVWLWQGDGSDHPESMVNSLPVVMTASTLREKQAEVRSLRDQLTAHKAALEKCEKVIRESVKWTTRIHLRRDDLPALFLDNQNLKPLIEETRLALSEISKLKGPK